MRGDWLPIFSVNLPRRPFPLHEPMSALLRLSNQTTLDSSLKHHFLPVLRLILVYACLYLYYCLIDTRSSTLLYPLENISQVTSGLHVGNTQKRKGQDWLELMG